MSAVGEAFVEIRPDSGGFASTLARQIKEALGPAEASAASEGRAIGQKLGSGMDSEIKPAMAKVQGTIGSSLKTIASFAQYYLGYQLVGAISQVPIAAVKVAGAFQQTQIAFTGLLGSATEANAFLKQLQQFAAATPFEFPQLTKAAQQLLAVGNNAKDIIPIMTTIGNVASALGVSGDEINHVVLALGQIKGAGVVHMQDLLQISNALPGFSAVAAIASERGESVAQAYNDIGKGAVPADEGIKAILEGMNKFPGSAGAMQRQSLTLNGVVSTLKDNLRNVAIDFITPKLPAITSAVQKFGDLVQHTFSGNIKQAAADLGSLFGQGPTSTFTKAIDRIGESFVKLAPVISSLVKEGFKVLGDVIGGLIVAFSYLVEGLAAAAEALTNPKKAIQDFGVIGTIAAGALGVLVVAIGSIAIAETTASSVLALKSAIEKLPKAAGDSVASIKKLADQVKGLTSKTISIAQSGAEGAATQVGKLVDAIKGLSDKTVTVSTETKSTGADKAKAGINGAIGGVAGGLGGLIAGTIDLGAIGTALAGVGSVVAAAVFSVPALIAAAVGAVAIIGFHFRKGIVHFFSDTLPRFVTEQIPHAFASAGEAIGHALSEAFHGAVGALGDVGHSLFEKGKEFLGEMGRGIKDGAKGVSDFFTNLPHDIAYALGFGAGEIFKVGKKLIESLGGGIDDAWHGVEHFFTTIVPSILGDIGDTAKTLWQKGKDLIQGMWDAVRDTVEGKNGLGQWFRELPGNIVQFIGDVARTLWQKGKDLLQGLWDAVRDTVEGRNGLGQWFRDLPGNIVQFVGDVARTLWQKGKDIISGFWNGIIELIHGKGGVAEFFRNLPGNILDFIGDVGRTLWQKGKDIIRGLLDGINDLYHEIAGKLGSVRTDVINAVGRAADWLLEAGKDVVRGLLNGISSLYESVIGKMKSLGGDIIKGFKDAAGIKSPSAHMHTSGVFLMQGLLNGIESQRSNLRSLVGSVAADVLDPFGSAAISFNAANASLAGGAGSTRNNHYNLTLNTARSASDVATQFGWMELAGLGGGS